MTNAYIVHRPTPYNIAPTGLYWFWHYIYIALTDYAIQYRPYGATRSQTNNPNGATLPSIAREGYENVREDYENTTTPQHSPERATLPSIARRAMRSKGYENMRIR